MGNSKTYTRTECILNADKGLESLLSFIAQATRFERENGLTWYKQEYANCEELADRYNLTLDTIVRVVACMSPQTRWSQNILIAEIVIRIWLLKPQYPKATEFKKFGGKLTLPQLVKSCNLAKIPGNVTGANLLKAFWVLDGHASALNGPKVESFYENLIRFGDSNRVTVDSHAILAWFGSVEKRSVSVVEDGYRLIENDYRRLAEILNISPLEAQAIVWVVRRRLCGSDQTDHFGVQVLIDFLANM